MLLPYCPGPVILKLRLSFSHSLSVFQPQTRTYAHKGTGMNSKLLLRIVVCGKIAVIIRLSGYKKFQKRNELNERNYGI
jgi:hypothetical protein